MESRRTINSRAGNRGRDANKALAEVRSWLCSNLEGGDAGKVCGMLSVVSRSINELESENAKLREERDYHKAMWQHATVTDCELRRVRAAWMKDCDENAKLRELVRMQDECIASNCEWCKHRKNRESLDVECELDDLACELGIER